MSDRTKRVAIIATVLFVIAVLTVVLFVREINIQSTKLSEQIMAIETERAQQEVFTSVQRISNNTLTIRQELQGYYLDSQSDSINFLNFIEDQAIASGVELTTNTPTETVKDDEAFLSVGYEFKGSLTRVENFIKQLENIPYISHLESLSLSQQAGGVWEAEVEIMVNILDYETQ